MSNSRFGIRWLVLPALAAIVAFIGLSAATSPAAHANPLAELRILPATQVVALGGTFTINVQASTDDITFAGYQDSVIFDQTKLQTVSVAQVVQAPLTTCGPTSFNNVGPPGQAFDNGCGTLGASPVPPTWTKIQTTITMTCGQVAGITALTLAPAADPNLPSNLVDTTGGIIATTLVNATVNCQPATDISITATHSPEPMIVGLAGKYTLTVTNLTPGTPAKGVVAADVVPADKTVQGVITCPGDVHCNPLGLGTGNYLLPLSLGGTVDGGVDLNSDGAADFPCAWYAAYPNLYPPPAGLANVVACYIAGVSGPPGGNHAPCLTLPGPGNPPVVACPASVKVIIPVMPTAPGTVTNLAQVPDCPVGAPAPGVGHSGVLLGLTCPWLGGAIPEPAPTFDNVLANNVAMDTHTEVPPDVTMNKDPDLANLWLCKGAGCVVANGEGSIVIDENVTNVRDDPDGVGAFEFVARWNHKVLDIAIADSGWLGNGDTRDVFCTPTLIDENAIHFGCVSKDPDWETAPGTPPIGPTLDGTIATLTVSPTADLWERLTPGQDNGVTVPIINDNCEVADIYGDPLSSGDTDPATGRQLLLPGLINGGEVAECGNSTITVRILEADLNLDCKVDVLDDQAEAYRYGASFGMLLYSPWYDLQPNLKDNDIDIKDVQKVFGRNGSTCADPIPAQDPVPPVDP